MGLALQSVREEDSGQQECVHKPRAGGEPGTFESGRKARMAGTERATGLLLGERRLEGPGAQTPGPRTLEGRV